MGFELWALLQPWALRESQALFEDQELTEPTAPLEPQASLELYAFPVLWVVLKRSPLLAPYNPIAYFLDPLAHLQLGVGV